MTKKGFTLVELLVVIAILGILAALLLPMVGGCGAMKGYYSQHNTGVYRCVKTYTVPIGEGDFSKRVDLEPQSGGPVETMTCDDDFPAGISNSATIYGQFEAGNWYSVESIGYRQEGWISYFPLVKTVNKVPDPTQPAYDPNKPMRAEAGPNDF